MINPRDIEKQPVDWRDLGLTLAKWIGLALFFLFVYRPFIKPLLFGA